MSAFLSWILILYISLQILTLLSKFSSPSTEVIGSMPYVENLDILYIIGSNLVAKDSHKAWLTKDVSLEIFIFKHFYLIGKYTV